MIRERPFRLGPRVLEQSGRGFRSQTRSNKYAAATAVAASSASIITIAIAPATENNTATIFVFYLSRIKLKH